MMRQLLPTRLYPGKARVGKGLARLSFDPSVQSFDGVDWYWLPSIVRAIVFLVRQRPEVVIFQWWTGTVVHSYIVLACCARLLGAEVVIEFHEVQDPGEFAFPLARAYLRMMAPVLFRISTAFVVHTDADRAVLKTWYPLRKLPIRVMPHGPHDHYKWVGDDTVQRSAPLSSCNLLFFGLIRPYKGLDTLIKAFDSIPEEEISGFWLTIVGETWEGWTLPEQLIQESRYRDRITFVNRYVGDEEVGGIFKGADAVVFPYRRSCISGPLHIAMGFGLPVVVAHVGGLTETVEGYGGAILIPPEDEHALSQALLQVAKLRGQLFVHPRTWADTADSYTTFLRAVRQTLPPAVLA